MDQRHNRARSVPSDRLVRLLDYLQADPFNRKLLADAASEAFDSQCFAQCDELLQRYEALGALPPALLNLKGLSAMSQGEFDTALATFDLLSSYGLNPVTQYNTAYAAAMTGRFDQAVERLDEKVLADVQQAAALKIRSLHHLGRLEEAIELASQHASDPHNSAEICGLLATALLDAGDIEGARHYAAQSQDTSDGLTVRGLLSLDETRNEDALALFEQALKAQPDNRRAHLGMGLALLAQGNFSGASKQIDVAAQAYGKHAGSWIAAGWAHLLGGDLTQARARFDEGARVDRGFAEAPGGIAVVDVMEGKLVDAKRHAATALRLDRACLSAALAQSLLSSAAGDQASADAIRNAALQRPLTENGKTIAQALAQRAAKTSESAPHSTKSKD